jgi:hypothetical protein
MRLLMLRDLQRMETTRLTRIQTIWEERIARDRRMEATLQRIERKVDAIR